MTVSYKKDIVDPAFYPDQIQYGGNVVQFGYEDRLDKILNYQAGSLTSMALRLKRVVSYEVSQVSSVLRDYKLDYETDASQTVSSRLKGLTECGRDGDCLAPTKFGWPAPLGTNFAPQTWQNTDQGFASTGTLTGPGLIAMDVNGDGKPTWCSSGTTAERFIC